MRTHNQSTHTSDITNYNNNNNNNKILNKHKTHVYIKMSHVITYNSNYCYNYNNYSL